MGLPDDEDYEVMLRTESNLFGELMTQLSDTLLNGLVRRAEFIVEHAAEIYVHVELDGKWGSKSLVDLPPRVAIAESLRIALYGLRVAEIERLGFEEVTPS